MSDEEMWREQLREARRIETATLLYLSNQVRNVSAQEFLAIMEERLRNLDTSIDVALATGKKGGQ